MIPEEREKVVKAIAEVINIHSLENLSDTPDFILAEYLVRCLEAYGETVKRNKKWHN